MFSIGKNTYISPKAKIIAFKNKEINFIVGDNSYIGDDVQIICDNFVMGDYCKIQHHCNVHGNTITIGHNAWIGQYTVVDCLGGVEIGNNFAIGPSSFVFSHAKYGDTLEGCRFDYESKLKIDNDVWLAGGHTTVYPVHIKNKAMTLAGTIITKDLEENRIYAGAPARDITDKIGAQFLQVTINEKYDKLSKYLKEFGNSDSLVICKSVNEFGKDNKTYFDVDTRTYTKKNSDIEIAFVKYLLPSKAKFTPFIWTDAAELIWTEAHPEKVSENAK
jgi:acetyltransferase-like isoleucine patch superfamily enzyme